MSTTNKGPSHQAQAQEEREHGAPGNHPSANVRQRSRERTRHDLECATLRVLNKGQKLTISAVATEAGVTPGLIHNTYPDVAEAIRAQVGRGTRQQRDANLAELAEAKKRMRELRVERDSALADVRKLASLNETLRTDLATLRALSSGNVVVMPKMTKG